MCTLNGRGGGRVQSRQMSNRKGKDNVSSMVFFQIVNAHTTDKSLLLVLGIWYVSWPIVLTGYISSKCIATNHQKTLYHFFIVFVAKTESLTSLIFFRSNHLNHSSLFNVTINHCNWLFKDLQPKTYVPIQIKQEKRTLDRKEIRDLSKVYKCAWNINS